MAERWRARWGGDPSRPHLPFALSALVALVCGCDTSYSPPQRPPTPPAPKTCSVDGECAVHEGCFGGVCEDASGETLILVGVGIDERRILRSDADGFGLDEAEADGGDLVAAAVGTESLVGVGVAGVLWTYRFHEEEWTRREDLKGELHAIVFGRDRFVAVGGSTRVAVSTTHGSTWMDVVPPTGPTLRGIAYGDGIFVAVGDDGRRMRSVDGLAWTDDVRGGANLRDVVWTGSTFWAFGERERRVRSRDGVAWIDDRRGESATYESVAWGNGFALVASKDGVHRATLGEAALEKVSEFPDPPLAVAYGGGAFFALDLSGTIWRSDAEAEAWTEFRTEAEPLLLDITLGWLP